MKNYNDGVDDMRKTAELLMDEFIGNLVDSPVKGTLILFSDFIKVKIYKIGERLKNDNKGIM